jgi:CMP-N-acetylneuraminic acid synthetase
MIPAILVGRKGSKGFPGKNTYEVMGKPLCYYPSKIASQVELIDEIYFSTDCPKMKDFAHKENYKIIDRPNELAQSDSNPEEVFLHAYEQILNEKNIKEVEMLVLLMANCVTITKEKILEGIKVLRANDKYDSAVTVSSYNSYSPHRARKIDENGLLQPFIPFEKFEEKNKIRAERSALGNVWFADMGVSIVRPHCLINWDKGLLPQKWMGNKIYPIKQEAGFDIDYEYELPMVQNWLKMFGDL